MDDDLKRYINDFEKRIAALEDIVGKIKQKNSPSSFQGKKISIREFLIGRTPSDDVKMTLAIGYYFEKFEGFATFNSDDLQRGYESAKEKKPANINDKVNMNIKKGHMAEASEKKANRKAWYVTNSGEQFVKSNFKA